MNFIFMRAIQQISLSWTFVAALSIAVMPMVVNGQSQSLSTVNLDKSSNPDLKDSVKDGNKDIARLISAVFKHGDDAGPGSNLAPVIGLPKAMPTKDVEVEISSKADVKETRRCFVVYEDEEHRAAGKNPVCAYALRVKRSGLDKETRYFKFDLNGKLEKVVLSKGKYDSEGKVVRGSGVKFDEDINSPEVKKAFDAEMKFWLKDWLKKERKKAAAPK